jgi:hypothetical protein
VYVPPTASTGYAQINFQVPLNWNNPASFSPASLTVLQVGSLDTLTPVWPSSGGFYSDPNGFATAQHADFTVVSSQNPAHPGETISVYADDFFRTYPPPPIGYPTPAQPLFTPVYVGPFGDLYLQARPLKDAANPNGDNCPSSNPVRITFIGLAPGLIGTEQINFLIPANQPPGDLYLFFAVTPLSSPPFTRVLGEHSN